MNRRSGFSLLELLIVTTFTSVLLVTMLGLFQVLTKLDRGARDEAGDAVTLQLLATAFCQDVAAASDVKLAGPDAEGVRHMHLHGKANVEYLLFPGEIRREATVVAAVPADLSDTARSPQRETFRFAKAPSVRVEVDRDVEPVRVTLILERRIDAIGQATRDFAIESFLGKDLRFQGVR